MDEYLCMKCGSKMYQYHTDSIDGDVYYCCKNNCDHPWYWFKLDGTVEVKL